MGSIQINQVAVLICLIIFGLEYGSARWGTREDIAPYVDPIFQNNVILTKTESLTMNSRPKAPKTARDVYKRQGLGCLRRYDAGGRLSYIRGTGAFHRGEGLDLRGASSGRPPCIR